MRPSLQGRLTGFGLSLLTGWLFGALLGAAAVNSVAQNTSSPPGAQGLPLPAMGESYFAGADFVKSWEKKENPYGAWIYGWSDGLYGKFVVFPVASILPEQNHKQKAWSDPADEYGCTPSVRFNFGEAIDDGNVDWRSGALILHGGGKTDRDYAHIIWVAPAAGHYSLNAVFEAEQHNVNADAHILISSAPKSMDGQVVMHLPGAPQAGGKPVSIYDTALTEDRMTGNYSGNFTFAAGDTIDFAVGQNNAPPQHPGSIALEAVIQKQ